MVQRWYGISSLLAMVMIASLAGLWACGEEPTVEVNADEPGLEDVDTLQVDTDQVALAVGETQTLEVTAWTEDGQVVEGLEFDWSTGDEAIADIDDSGRLTGVDEGQTEATVAVAEVTALVSVDVRELRWRDVAVGAGVSCATEWSGDIYCWGIDSYGVLGDPDQRGWIESTPTQVALAAPVAQVTIGQAHYCALDDSGQAICWGQNNYGEIGRPADEEVHPPTPVDDYRFVQIEAGNSLTCGLKAQGAVYCWGSNEDRRMGRPDVDSAQVPRRVVVDESMIDLAVGPAYGCAVDDSGGVHCWGSNQTGVVAVGDDGVDESLPTRIDIDESVQSVVSAGGYSCALTTDGQPICWGALEIGESDRAESVEPTVIDTDFRFQYLSAYGETVCGITESDQAVCWGDNRSGALGDGGYESRLEARAITGEQTFRNIAGGYRHSCGIDTDGELWCWGANAYGEAGDGRPAMRSESKAVNAGIELQNLEVARMGSCGATADGEATYCWGSNTRGMLQTDTPRDQSTPVQLVEWAPDVMAMGGEFYCGIDRDGRDAGALRCWGINSRGQFGIGNDGVDDSNITTEPVDVDVDELFRDVDAANATVCGLSESGDVYCWGSNRSGQTGVNPGGDQTSPGLVDADVQFDTISVGATHSCAVDDAGDAWCWGGNQLGQLGTGEATNYEGPTSVVYDEEFVDVQASNYFSCGLTAGGDVLCWGYGQIFTGDHQSWFVEEPLLMEGNWEVLDVGDSAICGLDAGDMYCAGFDWNGLLTGGQGGAIDSMTLVEPGFSVSEVAVGSSHVCMLDDVGQPHCQGTTGFGVLGGGENVDYLQPNPIAGQ